MGVCDPLNESILLQLAQRAGNSWQGLFDSGGQIRNIDRAVLAMFFNGHQHAFQHDEMTLGAAFQCHFGTAFAFRAQPMQIMDRGEQFRALFCGIRSLLITLTNSKYLTHDNYLLMTIIYPPASECKRANMNFLKTLKK